MSVVKEFLNSVNVIVDCDKRNGVIISVVQPIQPPAIDPDRPGTLFYC